MSGGPILVYWNCDKENCPLGGKHGGDNGYQEALSCWLGEDKKVKEVEFGDDLGR